MAKVMLVEDDNNLREIYEARLIAEGYEIVSAHDGEEALALAVKEQPDLIISDVMMPKISGFDMLDILRTTPETKNAKVIMMTALSQAEDKDRADKLGADRYLVKSQVTLEDVVRVAREVLDTSETPATTAPADPAGAAASNTSDVPVASPPVTSDPTASQAVPVVAPPADPAPAASVAPVVPTAIPVSEPPAASVASPAPAVEPDRGSTAEQVAPPTAQSPFATPTDAPATEPAPAPTSASSIEDQIKDFIATTEQVKNNAPGAPTENTATPAPTAEPPVTNIPVTVSEDQPAGQATMQPASDAPSVHKKVIQPINDITSSGPDLNALLAQEEQTADTPQPTVNSVITPAGEVQAPASAEPVVDDSGVHQPPHQPGDKIDPNSISL